MNSLKSLINQSEIDKAELQKLKKDIRLYINKKDIRKLIKKALSQDTYNSGKIDDKSFQLITKYSPTVYGGLYYRLTINNNEQCLFSMNISPLIISHHLFIEITYFNNKMITHDQVMTCLKTIIGL